MSSKETTKLAESPQRDKSTDLPRKRELSARVGPISSEVRVRSRFDSHTQSSLMKRREPMCPKKLSSTSTSSSSSSSMKRTRDSQSGSELNLVFSRLTGVCKRRNSITKQSRSLQALKMVYKREKDRRSSHSPPDDDPTKTVCEPKQRMEYSMVLFQDDLIVDVSRDLKRLSASPVKSVAPRDELLIDPSIRIIDRSENRVENARVSLQDEMTLEESSSTFVQDSAESICDCSEDNLVVDILSKIQSEVAEDEEEEAMERTDPSCELALLQHELSSGEPTEKSEEKVVYENRSEIERQAYWRNSAADDDVVINRKSTRKTWMIKKTADAQKVHVDDSQEHHGNLQGATKKKSRKKFDTSSRHAQTKPVDDQATRARNTPQRNPVCAKQRAWRPPGVNKASTAEDAVSLTQSTSQKSARSGKYIAIMRSKQASNGYIESVSNESTMRPMSAKQSKALMKENRDPGVDCASKIYGYFTETRQRQKQQNRAEPLPKRKPSTTKVFTNTSTKQDDIESVRSNSRPKPRPSYQGVRFSKHFEIPPRFLKNGKSADESRTEATSTRTKRSNTSEVIHALKEAISRLKENDDAKENAATVPSGSICDGKNSGRDKGRTSNEEDASPSGITSSEKLRSVENNNSYAAAQVNESCWKLIMSQDSSCPLFSGYNPEEGPDGKSEKIQTQTIATQTLLRCDKDVAEVGCNTTSRESVHRDAEVSCDLIGSAKVETRVDPLAAEDESFDEGKTHRTLDESEDTGEVPSTEMSWRLRDHVSVEVPVETMTAFIERTKEMARKERTTTTDEELKGHTESEVKNDPFRRRSLSILDFDASCSSMEFAEHVENVDAEETEEPEISKLLDIPSDVIAAFELAAERARNLHQAIMIYQEVMSRESPITIGNPDVPCSTVDEDCTRQCTLLASENEDGTKCHLVMVNNDFDSLSSCSSSDQTCSSSDQTCHLVPPCFCDACRGNRSENVSVSRSEQAVMIKSVPDENDANVASAKSLMLVHRIQGEHALEMVKFDEDGHGGRFRMDESTSTLALPTIETTHEKVSVVSRETAFPFICGVLCIGLWCLQFLFRCN